MNTETASTIEHRPESTVEPDGATPNGVAAVETPKQYFATIAPGPDRCLPLDFVNAVSALEGTLNMPVWLLVLRPGLQELMIEGKVVESFLQAKASIPVESRVALLIDSPGGQARAAYRIADLFRRRCGGFTAVVPRYAKSAATLVCLGADNIILGSDAELGPLDVQIFDADYEGIRSGLDEVQSLDRLHSSALQAVDQCVLAWTVRSGKKLDTLLPLACSFVASMMRPLFEKIDTVNYTQRSRLLREAEEYAIRLLQPQYRQDEAEEIARALVEQYPDHSFVIDEREACEIGLRITSPTAEQDQIFDLMRPHLRRLTAVGRIEEVANETQP